MYDGSQFHLSSEVWVADLIEMKFRITEAECRAKFRRVGKLNHLNMVHLNSRKNGG